MTKNDWHSAFCGATEIELNKNKDDLVYEREHPLSKRPFKMDMLIIKKNKGAVIENEIGRIFRQHNIVEFKGSGDSLNIDTYYKALAYACLYKILGKHVNEIPARELTVTLIREAYPRELFDVLKELDIEARESFPGIYYLSGTVLFPTQIIVTKRLSEKHSGFRILSKNADEKDVMHFLKEARPAKEQGEKENIDAVLQVSINANRELYDRIKEDKAMSDALKELMADVIEEEKKETIIDCIKKLMKNKKYTAKEAMSALGISLKDQKNYMTLL